MIALTRFLSVRCAPPKVAVSWQKTSPFPRLSVVFDARFFLHPISAFFSVFFFHLASPLTSSSRSQPTHRTHCFFLDFDCPAPRGLRRRRSSASWAVSVELRAAQFFSALHQLDSIPVSGIQQDSLRIFHRNQLILRGAPRPSSFTPPSFLHALSPEDLTSCAALNLGHSAFLMVERLERDSAAISFFWTRTFGSEGLSSHLSSSFL